jgi:hypothetical protein
MPAAKTTPRSPLKETRLRAPGASIHEHIVNIALDRVLLPLIIAFSLLGVLAGALAYAQCSRNLQPILLWALAALVLAAWVFTGVSFLRHRRIVAQLQLGMHGEMEVAQILDALREDRYRIFHDIPCQGETTGAPFNIDHVLIGPTGVYALETKTRSKRPDDTVEYDGQRIRVAGHTPDRDPLAQARRNAKTLRAILKDQSGRDIPVRPVVLFPGWWVNSNVKSPNVWVLNPLRQAGGAPKSAGACL